MDEQAIARELVHLAKELPSASVEDKARAVGESKSKLLKRLNSARSVLSPPLRKKFGKGTFDFAKKRLISDDGKAALQWKVRDKPDEPESYNNQQTGVGSVSVVKVANTETSRKMTAGFATDGALWEWGYNGSGALGTNTIIHSSTPAVVVRAFL